MLWGPPHACHPERGGPHSGGDPGLGRLNPGTGSFTVWTEPYTGAFTPFGLAVGVPGEDRNGIGDAGIVNVIYGSQVVHCEV